MKHLFALSLLSIVTLKLFAQPPTLENDTLTYNQLDSLSQIAHEAGDYENWFKYINLSLDKAASSTTKADTIYAYYLVNLGHYYIMSNQFSKAKAVLEEALQTQHSILGEQSAAVARTYNHLGGLYSEMNKYKKAISYYEKSTIIRKNIFGEEHTDYAESKHNLAAAYQALGKFREAISLYLQVLPVLENLYGENHRIVAICNLNMAIVYHSVQHYDLAINHAQKGKAIMEKIVGKDHLDYAYPLNNLASLYLDLEKYEEALLLFKQGSTIVANTLGKEHPSYAITLNNIATLYYQMGKFKLAIEYYEKALAIYKQVYGENNSKIATTLNNMASAYNELGNNKKALKIFKQSLAIYKVIFGENHSEFALMLQNVARLHLDMGNYDKAESLLKQANKINQNTFKKNHPTISGTANLLADFYFKTKKLDQAREVLIEGLNNLLELELQYPVDQRWTDELTRIKFKSNRHLSHTITLLESLYRLLKDSTLATTDLQQQIRIADLATMLLYQFQYSLSSDKDKLRMLKQQNDWLRQSLRVLDPNQQASKAFLLSDQNKSVLLLKATQSEATYYLGELPDSLIWKNKQLLQTKRQLQAQLLENRPKEELDSFIHLLNTTHTELDEFVRMLRKHHPKYYALNYQQLEYKVADIQQRLNKQAALIEYVISNSTLHIFCIQQDKVQWIKQPLPADTLRQRVKKLHDVLSNYTAISSSNKTSLNAYKAQAHWFYQQLLQTILDEAVNIRQLIIVTDGEIGHLPFECFLTTAAPATENFSALPYLLKEYKVTYNYSAALWLENSSKARRKSKGGKILGIAAHYPKKLNPNLLRERGSTTRWAREALAPLPAARQEVQALQELYAGNFAFDSLATEQFFKRKAGDFAIIHLAMHGLLDEKRPLLSSLAFTEDGDSSENNFLQAYEISKLELQADLVVLSACETGYGRFETGNGIASLARAFMYAGVPSLVVSLWQVNDASTSLIMQNFYANLAKGMDKAEALRQAKLSYIERVENPIAAHPAFWSPFILIGDEDPLRLQRKRNQTCMYWTSGGIALLGLFGFLGLSRKKRVA